jgi:hypothetical protein
MQKINILPWGSPVLSAIPSDAPRNARRKKNRKSTSQN